MVGRSEHYDDDITRHIAKLARRLEVYLESHMFDRSNMINILSLLSSFELACDMNGHHEGAAMCLFHFL